jgi:regulatory protein
MGGEIRSKMRTITAIEVQKKNPNRVNIHLDDQFAFGLNRIVAVWMKVGQQLTDEKITALQEADARESAMQKALHFLGYRHRSVEEVRKNLQKHEIPAEVIEDTIIKLEQENLLGDGNFAREWVENRSTFRPKGKRVLALELRQKGLTDEVIQEALDKSINEEALALKAAQKHAGRLKGLAWPEFRQKLSSFLGRRGFSFDVIIPVTRQVWEDSLDQKTSYEDKDLK